MEFENVTTLRGEREQPTKKQIKRLVNNEKEGKEEKKTKNVMGRANQPSLIHSSYACSLPSRHKMHQICGCYRMLLTDQA